MSIDFSSLPQRKGGLYDLLQWRELKLRLFVSLYRWQHIYQHYG